MNPNTDEIQRLAVRASEAIMSNGADSVVVIATFKSPAGPGLTSLYKHGGGNFYAQKGSVIDWIDSTKELPSTLLDAIGTRDRQDNSDDSDWWKNEQ